MNNNVFLLVCIILFDPQVVSIITVDEEQYLRQCIIISKSSNSLLKPVIITCENNVSIVVLMAIDNDSSFVANMCFISSLMVTKWSLVSVYYDIKFWSVHSL